MQVYLNQITDNVRMTIMLESHSSPAGTLVYPGVERMNQIDNLLLKNDAQPAEPVTYDVTGRTDSKLYAIINSIKTAVVVDPIVRKQVGNLFGKPVDVVDFDVTRFLNTPIRIAGTDITATITTYSDQLKEYTLYSDTEFPIKYVDFPDGTTTFKFSKIAEESNQDRAFLTKFPGLVEEPKIESSVFIERGIVNVFEPFTKLKKVKSLNEMTKFGFGYFKINKQGFNF